MADRLEADWGLALQREAGVRPLAEERRLNVVTSP